MALGETRQSWSWTSALVISGAITPRLGSGVQFAGAGWWLGRRRQAGGVPVEDVMLSPWWTKSIKSRQAAGILPGQDFETEISRLLSGNDK
jgi:hypothetical protein